MKQVEQKQTFQLKQFRIKLGFCFWSLVEYCHESLFVRNGWADCNPSNKISGTVCSFSCYDGYELSSDSITSKTCDGTSFSSGNVECISK
jgi:hypothetical protein